MQRHLSFHTLDVFTDTPFAGNPLAVVHDAGDLSPAQMQIIAREFNLSETIFVMPPRDPAHTARVRIFFPTAEIPFAGHPTVGCAVLLAEQRNSDGDFMDRIVLEEEAGIVPVSVARDGNTTRAEFVAPIVPFAHEGNAPLDLVAAALGLEEQQVGFGEHTPGLFQGGPAFLLVPVSDLAALGQARPFEPHWSALMEVAKVDSAYLYVRDDGGFCTRMFSPTAGIPEDPATGSAATMLAAQLLNCGEFHDGGNAVTIRQGVEMGRPSLLQLKAEVADGALLEVRVGGTAVRMSSGEIRVPDL